MITEGSSLITPSALGEGYSCLAPFLGAKICRSLGSLAVIRPSTAWLAGASSNARKRLLLEGGVDDGLFLFWRSGGEMVGVLKRQR